MELANAYVQDLHTSIRERVYEHVRYITSQERAKIVLVRQVALAEEKSHREFIAEQKVAVAQLVSSIRDGCN